MKTLKKNHNTCRCATKCDSMQIVNLNTASFAGQVRMGLLTIGIHLVETGYGLDVLGWLAFSPKVNHSTSVYAQ